MGRLGLVTLSSLAVASAWQNSAPLFLFSTSKHLDGFESSIPQLTASSHIIPKIEDSLKACTAKSYVVVSQPSVRTADYAKADSAPYLRRYIGGVEKQIKSTAIVPEIIGGLDGNAVSSFIEKHCGAAVMSVDAADGYISLADEFPRVIEVQLQKPARYPEERAASLKGHDSFLNAVLSSLHEANYTVIYTTTPPNAEEVAELDQKGAAYEQYQMSDEQSPIHIDLRRDVEKRAPADAKLPLFETYQFISPAIFMGFVAILPLLILVYVGVSAVAGLEVSYFAFSKEMGPAGQRK